MQLFIGNLTKHDTAAGLLSCFRPLRHDIQIQVVKLSNKYTTMYHGLVTMKSDKQATKAIKSLNNVVFHDRHLTVKEYVHRASNNDRREINWRDKQWSHYNRRTQERRNRWSISVVDEFDTSHIKLSLATRMRSMKMHLERLPGKARKRLHNLMSARR